MTKKKIFVIVLILFILAGGSLAVYNLFLKNKQGPATSQGTAQSTSLQFLPISQEEAFSPMIDASGQIKYYAKNSGHILESAFDGSGLKTISGTDLPDLAKSLWSPDGQKVISYFNKGGQIKKNSYSFQTKKSAALADNIKEVTWSPDSQKIAYQFETPDGSQNTIAIANPDGSAWKNILSTRLENLQIAWPAPNQIYIWPSPSGQTTGSVFSINVDNSSLTKIISDIYGLAAVWSPDGQKMIYQTTDQNGKNPKLYLALSDGSQAQDSGLTTLIDKCTFASDSQTIFCAVPQEISQYAVWPDDFSSGRLSTTDDLYSIDVSSLQKTKIAASQSDQSFDAQGLLLSPDEAYLFFINKKDGLLYSIKLK